MADTRYTLRDFAVYMNEAPAVKARLARADVAIGPDGLGVFQLHSGNMPGMEYVQSLFVSNPGTATITVTHRATGFVCIILPKTQGWHVMPATEDLTFDVQSSAANSTVRLWLSNVFTGLSVTPSA